MIAYSTIAVDERRDAIVVVTLNRPDKRNPISPMTCGELCHALERARDDARARVVVLTGAGKVFSAGGDLSAMAGGLLPGSASGAIEPRSLVDLVTTMHDLGKPIVAMVNGHALAGGLGLVVAADIAIAADDATFGTTEIRLGLWPMMITAELCRNIGRKQALRLMLTGDRIGAAEAAKLGLITRAVAADALVDETMAVAEKLAEKSPSTLALGLRAFYGTQDMPHLQAMRHLEGKLAEVLATEDAAEGIAAFLGRRQPVWKGR
ncbi:MAG TPA: enoyl-CoA hydratase/isomerase family protein [Kofleriaceae bacterium]|nr:enoyl-CoA hydratase/isomerase family protein [Kofleriaceae bacterium]